MINKKEKVLHPFKSFITGVIAFLGFFVGIFLQTVYPTPPGHLSALYSYAGPVIFILSMASFILGPIALFTGIPVVRQASKSNLSKRNKTFAWIGVVLGGGVSSMFLIAYIWMIWVYLTK